MHRFVGTWTLEKCFHELNGADDFFPFGEKAQGILVYTAEGYMTGALSQNNRKHFSTADLLGGDELERAEAQKTYLHYAGPFKVFENHVEHHVMLSLFPNWIGSIQKRYFEFYENGNKLKLFSKPFVHDGVKQVAYLTWRKLS